MKPLSIAVALFGLVALIQPVREMNGGMTVLGIVTLIAAFTTYRSVAISSFLKIFIGIFSVETIIFGLAVVVARAGWWPKYFAAELPPELLPLTVAIFAILVYAVSRLRTVEQIMRIADRYFDAGELARARIWPFHAYELLERRIAAAMIVFLVVINQAEVAITVRLNFFNRAWFDAIQQRNETVFWEQLLFVFTPYAFLYGGDDGCRIVRAADAGAALAHLADRPFRVALASTTTITTGSAWSPVKPTTPTSVFPKTFSASSMAAMTVPIRPSACTISPSC